MDANTKYVIDRIEKGFAVCENQDTNEYINIQIDVLPENIKEGDIIELVDNTYIINEEKTNEKKQDMKSRIDNLWKK